MATAVVLGGYPSGRIGHKSGDQPADRPRTCDPKGGQTPGEGEPLAAEGTAAMEFTTPEAL
jgi:hypothetical protein